MNNIIRKINKTMGFWKKHRFSTIDIEGEIDLNDKLMDEWVEERVLAWFDTNELKEEIKKREEDPKHYLNLGDERRRRGIKIGHTFEVNVGDVLDEVEDQVIFDEAENRNYKGNIDIDDCRYLKLKDILVAYFDINGSCYSNDEIIDMVKNKLKYK